MTSVFDADDALFVLQHAGVSQAAAGAVTLFGAIYLGIVAICPLIAGKLLGNSSLAIGGTSVIIVVGVALETVRALEAQMLMRNYKGFLN